MGLFTIISKGQTVIVCNASLTASGTNGIYETEVELGTDTGLVTLSYDAKNVPDRFQLIYDGAVVADSKYVGDGLSGNPPTYPGLDGQKNLDVFEYVNGSFVATGEVRSIFIQQSDIADGSAQEPNAGVGSISFTKSTAQPSTLLVRVTGPVGGTGWDIDSLTCPQ